MIDLMGKRKYLFIASAVLILIGVLFFAIRGGLTWDISFEGGTVIKVEMADDDFEVGPMEDQIRTFLGRPVYTQKEKTFNPENGGEEISLLTIKISKEHTLTSAEINGLLDFLDSSYNVKADTIPQIHSVEPFIGTEMRNKSLMAAGLAILLIVVYVGIRFRVMSGLPAALFGIVALLHDALIMLSAYVVFNIPINEVFIAAILTILGYSMNDTIIIYDRIRENTASMHKADIETLVNTSAVQTLPRTINTTVTTLICIVSLYVFSSIYNVTSIREFSLPLIIGIVSGSYSSIFVAAPLWMLWKKSNLKKKRLEMR
ncbi:MAG: protein translocase subunit SecF [Clostridia bacterium]